MAQPLSLDFVGACFTGLPAFSFPPGLTIILLPLEKPGLQTSPPFQPQTVAVCGWQQPGNICRHVLDPQSQVLLHAADASQVEEVVIRPLGYQWSAPVAVPALRPTTAKSGINPEMR